MNLQLRRERINRVLELVETGPKTLGELVEATGAPRRTLSTILKGMRERGQLKRAQSLKDTRKFYYLKGDKLHA